MVTLILRMTKTRKACHPVILLPFTPPTQTPGQCTESPPSHLTWKAWVKVTLRNTFLLSSCTFMYFFCTDLCCVLIAHCLVFHFWILIWLVVMVFIFAILCDHGTRMFVKKIDFKLESLLWKLQIWTSPKQMKH